MLNFNREITFHKKKSKLTNHVQKATSFNYLFFGTLLLGITGISLGNFLIDPYDIFRHNNPVDLKLRKPEKIEQDRLYKTIDVINIKPEIILIGSSRVKQGLNPNHPALPKEMNPYNLGIDGSNTYEILRYLEHTYVNQPNLKTVIMGLDHYMFNDYYKLQDSFVEKRLSKTHIIPTDLINTLFSQDAIIASKNTITENLTETENQKALTYGDNGFFPYPYHDPNDGNAPWRFRNTIQQYFGFHPQYKLSEARLNDFKKIVEFCRQHNINLIVFISPAHATQWETLRVTDRWDTYEQWKRKMVEVTPVWDFSGYNSITTEPIQPVMSNYVDNSHYTPKIGDFVLNRILSHEVDQVPQDFGVLMTPENIDKHLIKIRADREKWAKMRPNEVELVETLKRNFKPPQKSK
ncbi:hypothetical protein [Cyanothece sp. BG0011]|uniref:hypothetical protein n=1 Tax=Cyanothece sp. BG0011 TaxID=2082950 RepID=UPI000D1E3B9D|nr:hypothetical protein [Cyanothece sp. BG0011]